MTYAIAKDAKSELVGVWEGTAKNKIKIGIHIASIGDDGTARALYCWTRKDGSMVAFDTGPGLATKSVLEDGKLRAVRGACTATSWSPRAKTSCATRIESMARTRATRR